MTPARRDVLTPRTEKMHIKWVLRLDKRQRIFRIARLLWMHGTPGMPGGGYSAKLSFALHAALYRRWSDMDEWGFTVLGVRVHYLRAYGGIIT